MKALIIALGIVLAGCATGTNTVEVKVPVAVPCKVERVEIQPLPVDVLEGMEDIFTQTKYLWASIETQQADIIKLKAAVEACQ